MWHLQLTCVILAAFLSLQIGAIRPPALLNATRVIVIDDWVGYALISPIQSHYEIGLIDSMWVGEDEYSVTAQGGTFTARPEIKVPKPVMDSILRGLSDVKLSRRESKPKFDWTDDYPYRRLLIILPSDSVEFLTCSQGKHNTPWQVTFADSSFTTGSHAPANALKKLQPFLHKEVLDSLKTEAKKRSH